MPPSLTVAVLFHGLLWAVACSAAGETGRTAIVGPEPGQEPLLAALQDQDVLTIHLAGQYHVADEFEAFVGNPVKLTRNVTLMGQPGQPDPVLDLDFANSVVELCSSCVFSLHNITVKNERRGTGPYFDIFVGQPGSRVKPFHVHRWHLVCTSASESAETIRGLPRSPLMPRPDSPQDLSIANVTFQGKVYPDSLRYNDVTFDVPHQHQEGRGWSGGYALGCTGGIRICDHYVKQDCLIDNTPDYCVTQMTDAIMAGAKQPSSSGGGNSSSPGLNPAVLAAAVAVPIVLLAALGAALALLLVRRKRRRQMAAKAADTPPHSAQRASTEGHRTHGPHRDSASMQHSRHPAGFGQGWQLSSQLTSPLVGPVDDPTIEFGEMLGSGSFGRVFAARWAGREVAVKLIEHSTETIAAVESEMQLMLSFNNDNIVRAYHCATYTRVSTAATGSEYSSNSMLHTQPSLPREPSIARTHSHPIQMPAGAIGVAAAGGVGVASPQAALRNGSFDSSGRPTQDGSARITPRGGQRRLSHGDPQQLTPTQQQQVRIAACVHPSTGGSCTTGGSFPLQTSTKSSKGSASKGADSSKRAETHLVEEYCDNGTLTSYIAGLQQGPGGPVSEDVLLQLLLLLKDAASGLACLHANHVVHGDLNGRNVLVASSSKADLGVTAKVADLGLSRVIKHHETHRTTNTVGTMSHMPPELLRYGRMSPAVDIYAFGVMMWELYTSQPAFRKLQYGQFFETVVLRNLRPMIPPGMPADYQLLMEHCWATDPECRPNVERLLECLRFMIQERADRQDSQPLLNLQHSKSAPSPMALLKPLPDKRKHGAAGLGAGDEGGAAAARAAPGCSNESLGAGPQSCRIHSSFSGLIVGSDFGEAGVLLDTSAAADRSAHGGNHSGPVVLDAQQLAAAVNRRAAAQQENAQQFYTHPSSGYLGTPVSLSATPAAGLPPRLAPRPPPAANSNNQPPWAPEQEQAWCI